MAVRDLDYIASMAVSRPVYQSDISCILISATKFLPPVDNLCYHDTIIYVEDTPMSMANSISSLTKEELDHFIDGLEKVPGIDPKAIWYFRTGLIIRQQLAAAGEDEASARWVFNNWLYAVRMTFPVNAVENYDTGIALTALIFQNSPIEDFHAAGKPLSNQENEGA